MAGLSAGTVPAFYREVFDVMRLDASKICKEVWVKCFKTSKLPASIIAQIWKVCDPGETGYLSRDGFYKSMALSALGQQGKGVEEKTLMALGDVELPRPDLASLPELRNLSQQVLRVLCPTELGYSYEEVKGMDDITVTIMPEKKGMVFKYVEYLVESRLSSGGEVVDYIKCELMFLKSSTRRRYKDFESFNEALLSRYPYRLVPRMPPKKLTPSTAFIEQRRRALKRYVVLVVRHPVLAKDEMVRFFLTAGGQEVGSKLKEKFKLNHDEFLFSPHAKNIEELVSEATRVKFERVSEKILLMQQIVTSMLQVAHNMENRSLSMAHDLKILSKSMSTLASDNLLTSSWTSGADDTWSYMQSDCGYLSGQFSDLSEKAKQQGVRETSGFTESVHLFLDLITAYLDLCERRERNVQRKHQNALGKLQTMVSYKGRMESTGRHLSERDDTRIIKRDDELIVMEKRNFFSLFCLDLEAQLVHINLIQLSEIYDYLISAQVKGHMEYLSSWDTIKVGVEGMKGRLRKTSCATIPNSSSFPSVGLNHSGDVFSSRSPPHSSQLSSTNSPFT